MTQVALMILAPTRTVSLTLTGGGGTLALGPASAALALVLAPMLRGQTGPAASAATLAATMHAAADKAAPADNDEFTGTDSAAAFGLARFSWANIKAGIKTWLDTQAINLAVTWANVATTFTALKVNVTDTASAAGSLLLDLQVGGVSKVAATKSGGVLVSDGAVGAPAYSFVGRPTNGMWTSGTNLRFSIAGVEAIRFNSSSISVMDNAAALAFGATVDTVLTRDAPNTFAQRNSTNAQTFRIYNTYTDASNYERLTLDWSSNTARLLTSAAGTGTARNLQIGSSGAGHLDFLTNGTGKWRVQSDGTFLALTDNTYDIGTTSGSRPRNVYAAGSVTAGGNFICANASGGASITFQPITGYATAQYNDILYNPQYNSAGGMTAVASIRLQRTSTADNSYDGSIQFWTRRTGSALTEALRIDHLGNVQVAGAIKTAALTVATLTAAATAGAGARSFVTDATVTHAAGIGAAVVGGGANKVPVYSDGVAWRVG
jgi:hypothetical protein